MKAHLFLSIDLTPFQRLLSYYGHNSAPTSWSLKADTNHLGTLTKAELIKTKDREFYFFFLRNRVIFAIYNDVSLNN